MCSTRPTQDMAKERKAKTLKTMLHEDFCEKQRTCNTNLHVVALVKILT